MLGDEAEITRIMRNTPNKHHCAWLKRDPNACECIPSGVPGTTEGEPCPYNAYAQTPELFERASGVSDTIERLMRLVNSAELGILNTEEMSPLDVTELITVKVEMDRQDALRREEMLSRKPEAAANKDAGAFEAYFQEPENRR